MLANPLRTTLTVNAATSVLTGLLLFLDAPMIAALLTPADTLFGLTLPAVCRLVGVGLIVFAALALLAARLQPVRAGLVWEVIALDIAWVLGSILLVELAWDSITLLGRVAILAVALVVATFALLQGLGLKRARA